MEFVPLRTMFMATETKEFQEGNSGYSTVEASPVYNERLTKREGMNLQIQGVVSWEFGL